MSADFNEDEREAAAILAPAPVTFGDFDDPHGKEVSRDRLMRLRSFYQRESEEDFADRWNRGE